MATESKLHDLTFTKRDGSVVKTYDGETDVSVSARDLGEVYAGTGAMVVEDSASTHQMRVSLDTAASRNGLGSTVRNVSVGQIVQLLGGTIMNAFDSQVFGVTVGGLVTLFDGPTTVTPRNGIEFWSVDWGDGTTEELKPTQMALPPHTYADAGTYAITLVDAQLKTLGESCFKDKAELHAITVPETVTSIGHDCFAGCTSLRVELIGKTGRTTTSPASDLFGSGAMVTLHAAPNYALRNVISDNLMVSVTADVTSLGTECFFGCTGLVSASFTQASGQLRSIGDSCFYGCVSLRDVSIPSTVTSVGANCFARCDQLRISLLGTTGRTASSPATDLFGSQARVTVRNPAANLLRNVISEDLQVEIIGAVSVGDGCFAGCRSLVSVTFSDALTGLGANAFQACDSLTTLIIPPSVKRIGINCFADCSNLSIELYGITGRNAGSSTSQDDLWGANAVVTVHNAYDYLMCGVASSDLTVRIAPGVTSIGKGFLKDGKVLSVDVLASVTSVGQEAFAFCANLDTLTLPESVRVLGAGCFTGCTGFTTFHLPESIKSLPADLFNGCTGLESVNVPSLVTAVGDFCFADCSNLKDIDLPSGLLSVGASAFLNDTALTAVRFPPTVFSLGSRALSGCANIEKVVIENKTFIPYPTDFMDGNPMVPTDRCTLFVPMEAKDAYAADPNWGRWNVLSLTTTVTVNVHAGTDLFVGETTVEPYADWTIDWGDGSDLDHLTKADTAVPHHWYANAYNGPVTIKGAILTSLGTDCFKDATGLIELVVPDSVTAIGDMCFAGCSSLESVTLSSTTKTLGERAFENCVSLYGLTVPPSVRSIGTDCFIGCQNLLIDLQGETGRTATSEPSDLFGLNASITVHRAQVNLFRNVTSEGLAVAFYDGGESPVLSIGDDCFNGCLYLGAVTIPETVLTLGERCFLGCNGLIVTLFGETGRTETSPATDLFGTNATVTLQATDVSANALRNVTSANLSVILNGSVQSVGAFACAGCTGLKSLQIASTGDPLTIGDSAFANSTGLNGHAVELPPRVEFIGKDCFAGLSDVSFTLSGTTGRSSASVPSAVFGNNPMLTVNAIKVANALLFNVTSPNLKLTFTEDVMSIGESAAAGCSGLVELTLPSKLDSLGAFAFKDVVSLTSAVVPDEVKTIGEGVFSGCRALTEITLPFIGATGEDLSSGESVFGHVFGHDPFDGGTKTQQSDGTDSAYTFYLPTALKAATITRAAVIPVHAFYSCLTVETIDVRPGPPEIPAKSFSGCGAVDLRIPEGVTSIQDAFAGCKNLTTIRLPSQLSKESVVSGIFVGLTKLKHIYVPNGWLTQYKVMLAAANPRLDLSIVEVEPAA